MSKVVTFGNFKGGTGKTTNSSMIGYLLAKKGYKVLLADLDPQANATSLFMATKQRQNEEVITFSKTLMTAVVEGSFEDIIFEVNKNLYLLPSYADFTSYPLFLEKKFDKQEDRISYFSKLLKPVKDDFDFILIDVPPTLSVFTDSAMFASDYSVIVLQTQNRSYDGAKAYISYLQELLETYELDFDILGILPVLLKNNAPVDKAILSKAKETFGDSNMFSVVIKNMERLKRYDITGIVDPDIDNLSDIHDKRVFKLYNDVADEFLNRIN
ncbi:ParA family protein [Enterococcus gilvus]|uniref:ParA family protein n=1 Tax=Enterococcus gilvus TaxID=160453 RepID=UPI003EDA1818